MGHKKVLLFDNYLDPFAKGDIEQPRLSPKTRTLGDCVLAMASEMRRVMGMILYGNEGREKKKASQVFKTLSEFLHISKRRKPAGESKCTRHVLIMIYRGV